MSFPPNELFFYFEGTVVLLETIGLYDTKIGIYGNFIETNSWGL